MPKPGRSASIVAYLIAALVIPATLTLNAVVIPATVTLTSQNPTPLGYTISLSLFVFPCLAIAWWFLRHPGFRIPKRAFLFTLALLLPTGIILDVLFGNAFFEFTNHGAVTGITFPAVGGPLPVEELIFYLSGFMTVLLLYIWCDEYWLALYNIPDYGAASRNVERLFRFHPLSFLAGLALILAAIVYKKLFSGEPDGVPWYFIYITLIALIPSSMLFVVVKDFINWRALAFTFFIIVLISLIWEATLALPYGWWGFRHEAMMGIYIGAWHELPMEEIFVWFSVSYTSIIFYESIKILLASEKSIRELIKG